MQRSLPGAPDIGRLQERLSTLDVRSKWHGWDDGSLVVETPDGDELLIPNEATTLLIEPKVRCSSYRLTLDPESRECPRCVLPEDHAGEHCYDPDRARAQLAEYTRIVGPIQVRSGEEFVERFGPAPAPPLRIPAEPARPSWWRRLLNLTRARRS